MNICMIGSGYVGLVTGTCFAEVGNNVICVDKDSNKIDEINRGNIPIYEPQLNELIASNKEEGKLNFTSNLSYAVQKSDICFIAVGTPQGDDGSADLQYVLSAAKDIAQSMNGYKIIVNKSTVPVGTAEKVAEVIKKNTSYDFDVVSNPEFLKQGAAVDDFMKPDRIIIGTSSENVKSVMRKLYTPFVINQNPIIIMDERSAEMVKYASNSFLAVKISFANEISQICKSLGADYDKVRRGMSADPRIGKHFLYSGIGYGGSCLPKDTKALSKIAEENGISSEMINAADRVNNHTREIFIDLIFKKFGKNLNGLSVAVWGLAFKPKTNDMRESPAITIINKLLEAGAKVKAYDPKAIDSAKQIWGNKISYGKNYYDILADCDCLLLLTEWNEFRNPDFKRIKDLLRNPVIFDARKQYNKKLVVDNGFEYYSL